MRTVTNEEDAACARCGVGTHAVLTENGSVVCNNCGSDQLMSRFTGGEFVAVFGNHQKTYRVNQYCPEMPDRRVSDRQWPVFKERRATRHASL